MNTSSGNVCRARRRPVEKILYPLLSDHGRVEKLATGKPINTKDKRTAREKLKVVKETLLVGI